MCIMCWASLSGRPRNANVDGVWTLNVILGRGDVVSVHRWASTGHMHIVFCKQHRNLI